MTRSMKLRLITGGLILILGVAGLFAYIFRERVYYRSPLLLIGEPRITFMSGEVRFRTKSSEEWQDATVGRLLGTGYEIETGSRSAADVRFQSRTAMRVKADSHIVLNEATIRGISVRLERGNAYGQFKRLFQQQRIEVITPTATTYVRGTELGFEMLELDPAQLDKLTNDAKDASPEKKNENPRQAESSETTQKIIATRVYALSGIVEVFNPEFEEAKTILSYQNSTIVPAGGPPLEPVKLSDREVERARRILNSIHYEDVLLITNQLQFVFGRAELLPESTQELDKIAELLKSNSDRVRIVGHTDNIGSSAANYRLSLARARAIRQALITRDVDAKRMVISGYGENKPIADNDTESGRQSNRRVEFLIAE